MSSTLLCIGPKTNNTDKQEERNNEMASQVYTPFKEKVMEAAFNLLEAGLDVQNLLVMDASTAGGAGDRDDEFIGDISDLDEQVGSGYTIGFGMAGRQSLGTQTVVADAGNDRGVFDAVDETWTGLSAGAGTLLGDVIMHEITNDAASPLILFVEFPSPVTLNGGDFTIQWHADGIMYLG